MKWRSLIIISWGALAFAALPVVELKPKAQAQELSRVETSIPYEKIKHLVPRLHFYSNDEWKSMPVVKAIEDDLLIAAPGINIKSSSSIPEGVSQAYIYDSWKDIRDKKRGIRGVHAQLVATAVRVSDNVLRITRIHSDFSKKSARISFKPPKTPPARINPARPESPVEGVILYSENGADIVGQLTWVMISGGADKGRKIGDSMVVLAKNGFVEEKGKLLLTNIFNQVSYGVITSSTDAIHLRDTVQ